MRQVFLIESADDEQIDADAEKDKQTHAGGRGSRRAVDNRLTGRFALPRFLESVSGGSGTRIHEQAIWYKRDHALPAA
jgi:hypothetical protein